MMRFLILLLTLLLTPLVQGALSARQQPVSLYFQEAPVALVLQALADEQQLNLIADEQISGTLTLKLDQVPWYRALEQVARLKQLTIEERDNILLVTRAQSQEGVGTSAEPGAEQLISSSAPDMVSRYIALRNVTGKAMAEAVRPFLSPQGSVLQDSANQGILLKEEAELLPQIVERITQLDRVQPQVRIAAHIVNISSESLLELGVRWGLPQMSVTDVVRQQTGFNVDLPLQAPMARGNFHLARLNGRLLDLELSALEQENQVEIIASPRLLTANLHTASIKQGTEIPYEVVSGNSGATAIEFKEAVLGMEVTPQVMGSGHIELSLLISQNMPGRALKRREGEILAIDKQEIQTRVTVAEGETLVLGGVFQQIKQKNRDQVPWLAQVPLVGTLFQRNSRRESRRELVIFITPTVVR
ncbi:MAG: type IV pilus secretin PilQ [Enterobacteriaceae bacterium]